MQVTTVLAIHASDQRVWQIITDAECYPEWNPFIRELHGKLLAGEPIVFRFNLIFGRSMQARAIVLKVVSSRELRWAGVFWRAWLFRAEHFHIIDPDRSGVRFVHGEIFSGVLAPLLAPFLRRWGERTYHAVNLALKQRAELQSAQISIGVWP
jgi:hypothetical protein